MLSDVEIKLQRNFKSVIQSDGTETGGMATGGVVVNQYIYANETNYAKQQREAEKNFRLIARTV